MEKITIKGTPYETGATCGSMFKDVLMQRTSLLSKKTRELFSPQVRAMNDILKVYTPHWLEELEGVRSVTGVSPEDIIMLNVNKPVGMEGDCSSVLSINSLRGGDNILHKNRDQIPFSQYFFIKQADGCYKYTAAGTIGDFGVATFLNEKGLAGANNSGSITIKDELSSTGFSDCHLLRIVAERAGNCEEALKVVQEIIRGGACGTAGSSRGMIFLFADRDKGLVVENTSKNLTYKFIGDGVLFRTNDFCFPGAKKWIDDSGNGLDAVKSSHTRYRRVGEMLSGNDAAPTLLMELARDLANYPFSINNDTESQPTMTLSAYIHVIRREMPGLLSSSWICSGNPSYALFSPWYIGGCSSPAGQPLNRELFTKKIRVTDRHREEQERIELSLCEEEERFVREIPVEIENLPEILDARNMEMAEQTVGKFPFTSSPSPVRIS